jgi:hypothetical protein
LLPTQCRATPEILTGRVPAITEAERLVGVVVGEADVVDIQVGEEIEMLRLL